MAKMKTNQAIAKRFKVTKKGKIEKRTAGQGHFNARESGKVGRNKRSDTIMSKSNKKVMTTFLQY
jgi:large subunit ribosomal protein L35